MSLTKQEADEAAQLLKLLGDPTRLRIIDLLRGAPGGEMHVTALTQSIGVSQPALSHHLSLCRHSGIFRSRREGKNNYYSVVPERLALLSALLADLAGDSTGRSSREVAPKAARGLASKAAVAAR